MDNKHKKLVKKILNTYPTYKLFRILFKALSRYRTWRECNKNYEVPIDPLKLLWISPEEVKRKVKPPFYSRLRLSSDIMGGEWDKENIYRFGKNSENHIWKSLRLRFEENKKWEETPVYSSAMQKIEKGKRHWHKCKTEKEIKLRLKKIEKIYEDIKKEGYKTQKEIIKKKEYFPGRAKFIPPELNEVMVNIDREGNFLFDDGIHRLTMAKILDVEKIPVRVLVRHEKWQKLREEIHKAESIEELSKKARKNLEHPDVQDIIPEEIKKEIKQIN